MAGNRPAPAVGVAMALGLALSAAPAFADGQLAIGSTPAGAAVWLDGRYAGVTPLLLDAPSGGHRVRLQLEGHQAREFGARVVDGLTTRQTIRLSAMAPARGELRVVTRPSGSALYLDGRAIGASPAHVSGLKPGRYRLTAVRRGHRTASRTVEIQPGLTSSLSLSLSLAPPSAPRATVIAEALKSGAERPAPQARPVAPRPAPPLQQAATARPAQPAKPQAPPALAAPAPAPNGHQRVPEGPEPLRFPLPAEPAPVAPTPVVADTPVVWPALRTVIFWALMLGLLGVLAARALRLIGRRRDAQPVWHPPRPARGPQSWPGPGQPDAPAALAVADVANGRPDRGAEALYAVLARQPGTAWHYYHLGLGLQLAGRLSEAEAAYRTAIQLEPGWTAAHFNLAIALGEAHQVPQAVIAYRQLLELQPDDSDALFNLGHLYFGLRMWPAAIAQWQSARQLTPRDAAVRVNLRFLKRVARMQARQRRARQRPGREAV